MAYCEWQENYFTNISEVDDHHRKLIALLNNLYTDVFECQNVSQKQPLIEKALDELIDYTNYHFNAEEELMLKYEYEGYASHKREHEKFKSQVTYLQGQHKKGKLTWSFPILNLLRDWLNSHILNIDKSMADILIEKNSDMM